jgi:hypothetical protein
MQNTCPTCGGPTCPHCGKSPYADAPKIAWVPGTTYPPPYEFRPYIGDVFPDPYVVTCGTWAATSTNTDECYLPANPMPPMPAVVHVYGLRSE